MKKIFIIIFLAVGLVSCSVYESFVNLSRLEFKLGNINGFQINGINISNKSKISDFSLQDALSLTSIFTNGNFPVSFTLNVEAKNPNDGTGGYKKTDATLKSFPWRLLIDNKETISGNIDSPVTIPGTGGVTNIPITIQMDLVKYFNDQGYESLINLALTLGGKEGSSSRLTLYANPVVSSPFGDISYPGELKIVDTKFTR